MRLNALLKNCKSMFILSTWHSNDYRKNKYLDTIWNSFDVITKEHFYHVGGYEKNRNPMLEALVTNFTVVYKKKLNRKKAKQISLFNQKIGSVSVSP
jgi:DNA adenine methylase